MVDKLQDINNLTKIIPTNPGVYQFYDKSGNLLYVGKAKNLKKRVQSYFNREHSNHRLTLLVRKTEDIKYVIVATEQDALLLENNLIKEHQPKYNIQLKDDKTFPWICIKNERFPRIFSTRNRIEDGSEYFGPYTSAYVMKTLLTLIKGIYPLRSCNYLLDQKGIESKKYRRCIEFQIGNCKAPCEGLQGENDYLGSIENIRKILKGNIVEIIVYLKNLMAQLAASYKFEEAEGIKQKITLLEKFQLKSTIVSASIKNTDVFTLYGNEKLCIVNYLKIINGAIVQSYNAEVVKKLDESDKDIILYAIHDILQKFESTADELILPFNPGFGFNKKITVPKIGEKKKLLDLSMRNAKMYLLEKERLLIEVKEKSPVLRVLENMKTDLRLQKQPAYIECFDNSNLMGTHAVSSCVVFRNAKPSKSEYRHFNIKTVEGPDDYASMHEVITRRYSRLIKDNEVLPDLIIIDGGKGQLSTVYEAFIELGIEKKVALIGIAKRLEEIYYPNDPVPLYLNKNTVTLKVIQNARNEAHRFGVTHHRGKRMKTMLHSGLDDIAGIGQKTKDILLKEFKSVQNIRDAGINSLEAIIGKKKAKILSDNFLNKEG